MHDTDCYRLLDSSDSPCPLRSTIIDTSKALAEFEVGDHAKAWKHCNEALRRIKGIMKKKTNFNASILHDDALFSQKTWYMVDHVSSVCTLAAKLALATNDNNIANKLCSYYTFPGAISSMLLKVTRPLQELVKLDSLLPKRSIFLAVKVSYSCII